MHLTMREYMVERAVYAGEFCRYCEVGEVSEREVEGDKLEMIHSTISSSTAQSS